MNCKTIILRNEDGKIRSIKTLNQIEYLWSKGVGWSEIERYKLILEEKQEQEQEQRKKEIFRARFKQLYKN